ncbi:hypothetical protein QN360_16080 [Glaciimonas sp. CA11.2]|uniref:hypothetical protein n=1 Tax=unclassified Glaciimonas TaxID=2644401 RepID=UPI002AB42074|nr:MULTISPECIES: hypothetical protein [unclassified Glaciimonas]MDY7548486.1 hypothetical protein [Glaciimonas sp. CA11.2]MEB0010366.1 hypothetical protein [Glaciimonas sp. Cout2]MEB0084855.1 hypothetical protein [Glaciimonas sp. Gout2]MEB0164413.1 hypothetical protein [Glaciimonas sp. CA11.2]
MNKQTNPPQSPTSEIEAFHKSFSWLLPQHRGDRHAQFYALTVDVCQGIKTCIDLAHFSNTDRDNGTMPTLDIMDTEHLLRLAISSSHMLAEMAAGRIDRINDTTVFMRGDDKPS